MTAMAQAIEVRLQPVGRDLLPSVTYRDAGSRCLDIAVALVVLVSLLPFLVLIAAAIAAEDRRWPLFAQTRIGRGGRPFRCYKFRTMKVDAEERLHDHLRRDAAARREWAERHKLRRDPRVTRLGDMLRRSSFDEWPQFINILRGDMSLVGPRPIVAAEVERYGPYFASYCQVRPGLTGLWQVSGRSLVSYRRRVALDTAYVRSKSLALDLKIMACTLPCLVRAEGAF